VPELASARTRPSAPPRRVGPSARSPATRRSSGTSVDARRRQILAIRARRRAAAPALGTARSARAANSRVESWDCRLRESRRRGGAPGAGPAAPSRALRPSGSRLAARTALSPGRASRGSGLGGPIARGCRTRWRAAARSAARPPSTIATSAIATMSRRGPLGAADPIRAGTAGAGLVWRRRMCHPGAAAQIHHPLARAKIGRSTK